MKIEDLRILCNDESIRMTQHCLKRCRERKITLSQIKHCIMNGEIIENYPDDYPYPSVLVMEFNNSIAFHVVVGVCNEYLWIITAYYPDTDRWNKDFKTRRGC